MAKKTAKKTNVTKKAAEAAASKKKAVKKEQPAPPKAKARKVPIVGIGASAGGLEAIEGLLGAMPPDTGMSFVVIQHLAPQHKSILDTLLKRFTKMEILQIEDRMKAEPNRVYLNPPDLDVGLMDRTFHLTKPDKAHAVRMPIDLFFRSLAEDQKELAIGVVLSGTGSDGTLGLKAIKGEGGMTMAQDEEQAKYSSMPKSAIDTGMVDFVLRVEDMAAELVKYIGHPYLAVRQEFTGKELQMDVLRKIFILIRNSTGQDFSNYKLNTLRRRIERRMAVHQIPLIEDYLKYVQQNPIEVETLARDMLIGVTSFFRDPEAFEALRKKALVPLMKKKSAGTTIRIWAPGCSTGEEAYSIAMEAVECMEGLKKNLNLQVFGTDIDHRSIETARLGAYPGSIAADVSAGRLKRFFLKEDDNFKIRKFIREMVVFADQNLIKDPPFSKLDLVSCRNVLIYMNQTLQKKIIPLLHYTLIEDGVLFLGTAETIGEFSNLFSPLDLKWKIYRKKGLSSALSFPVPPIFDAEQEAQREATPMPMSESSVRQVAETAILSDYAPPCVLIDSRLNIVYFHGKTDAFLEPPSGKPNFNILNMAREDFRYRLSAAIHDSIKENKTVTAKGLQLKRNGEVVNFDLIVKHIIDRRVRDILMLVAFVESPTVPTKPPGKKMKAGERLKEESRVTALQQELNSTREYLQTTIEELETSNEELQSTNEELQSTNEELQSTNEELETSREELQSTNEELQTVNAELQKKVDELSKANDDLNNLLASTETGTIFLDNDLRIMRFTPHVTEMFNLIKSDVGRPLSDITSNLTERDISADASNVLHTLQNIIVDVRTSNYRWYSMRINPYRTTDNVIDGVVVTFYDITKMKSALDFSEAIVNTIRTPLIVLDDQLRVISANGAFFKKFKVDERDTVDNYIYELGNRQWDIPELRVMLEKVLPENNELNDYIVKHRFPDIGERTMMLNARRLVQPDHRGHLILLAIEETEPTGSETP